MNIEEIISEVKLMSIDDLNKLKQQVSLLIETKNITKNSTYRHDCFGSSTYHFRKYKHYAKVLDRIDLTKKDGFAFVGDFLSYNTEDIVKDGSYIIEVCHEDYKLYKIENDIKELILEGRRKELVSFIKRVKELTNL